MGRQNDGAAGAIVGPSIALLQERFKKLERIKEKREEERQIMFSPTSEPKIIIPTDYNNYGSFSDEFLLPSRNNKHAEYQDPLSLGLNLNNKHADYRALKSSSTQPSCSSLWSVDKRGVKKPQKFDIADVDTSLHL